MTFAEWNNIPEFSMAGIHPCQECHMPLTTRPAATNGPIREVHRHTFVGVDLDLSQSVESKADEKAMRYFVNVEEIGAFAGSKIGLPLE